MRCDKAARLNQILRWDANEEGCCRFKPSPVAGGDGENADILAGGEGHDDGLVGLQGAQVNTGFRFCLERWAEVPA